MWAKMASVGYWNGWRTKVLDQEDRLTAANFTIGKAIAWYWEFAQTPPEKTRGSLKCQIEACKQMYALGHEPALAMLSELAKIDVSRTKGRRRGQEAAENLLKRLVSSIKVDKSGVQ
jgi:hypothetical protein